MLDRLDTVAWQHQVQPSWNTAGEVPAAIRALAGVESDAEAQDAYDRLLYAIGNNHAGTYYPVVLEVVPFLCELLKHPQVLVRETVLDVLTDLAISFEPEPGLAEAGGLRGDDSLKTLVARAVGQCQSGVRECAAAPSSEREAKLAQDLLGKLDDEANGNTRAVAALPNKGMKLTKPAMASASAVFAA